MQCILQQHASFAYALLAAAADRNFAQASLIANGLSIALFLSAGYLIVNLPAYIGWTKWMSPYFVGRVTERRDRIAYIAGSAVRFPVDSYHSVPRQVL